MATLAVDADEEGASAGGGDASAEERGEGGSGGGRWEGKVGECWLRECAVDGDAGSAGDVWKGEGGSRIEEEEGNAGVLREAGCGGCSSGLT
jgi:hypothetical protein